MGMIVGIAAAVAMVAIFATAGVVMAKKKMNRPANKVRSITVEPIHRPIRSNGAAAPTIKQAWSATSSPDKEY